MSTLALQACPVLPLPQAWWLGTHRRMDLLDVPSFGAGRPSAPTLAPRVTLRRRLHRLPSRLPAELMSLGDHLQGRASAVPLDALTALSLLLRHLAAPISYQADNPYAIHRAVPSPRCAYPCRVFVIERHDAGVRQWVYEGDHHALSPIAGPCDTQALLGDHQLAVIGVARHWMLADKYGDFAPFNATLEAGMAQSQLQHLAPALGWSGEPLEGLPAALRAASRLCEHPLETVAYGLRLSPAAGQPWAPSWPGEAVETDVAGHAPSPRLAEQFDLLPSLAAQFAAIGPAFESSPPTVQTSGQAPDIGLLQLMRNRSSGSDRGGLAPRLAPLPAGAREQLLALWRQLAARRQALPGEAELQPLLVWLDDAAGEPGLITPMGEQVSALPATQLKALLQDALPHPGVPHNLHGLKCHALWCADLGAAQARHGSAALRRLHLAAGAQAQDFSLAATASGLFARPLRMMREAVLEGGLALPGPLVYQVMCGLNRSTNTRWEL